jgi:hypothetical protein
MRHLDLAKHTVGTQQTQTIESKHTNLQYSLPLASCYDASEGPGDHSSGHPCTYGSEIIAR